MSQSLTPADTLLIPATDPEATVGLFFTVADLRAAMSPVGYSTPANEINAAAAQAAQLTANAAIPSASLGQPFGPVQADANSLVPLANLPTSVIGSSRYIGTWNASTNTPTLASGVPPSVAAPVGGYYIVSVAGSTLINGVSVWNAGDWIIWNGSVWDHLTGQINPVVSVAGAQGVVSAAQLAVALAGNTAISSSGGVLNVMLGSTAATAAAGNDSRITGAIQNSCFNTAGGPPALDSAANLSGQVIGPNASAFPTVASLRAYSIALLVDQEIATISNFATEGDNGGGPPRMWMATSTATADGIIVINPTGNTGAGRWVAQFTGPANVKWFGAIGNYSSGSGVDDTNALQAAITWCHNNAVLISSDGNSKNARWPLYFPKSTGAYFVTKSLNATSGTSSTADGNFLISGDGANQTIIVGKLTTANPILDLSGNTASMVKDLSIFTAGGLETLGLLVANTTANDEGGGNSRLVSFNTDIGAALIGCDLCSINNCNITNSAGWGLVIGGQNATAITSAYQTIAGGNTTLFHIENNSIISSSSTTCGALWVAGVGTLVWNNCYVDVNGPGGAIPSMVRIGNGGLTGNQMLLKGVRSENQSSQTGMIVFQTYGAGQNCYGSDFSGTFNTDSEGYVFDCRAAAGALQNSTIQGIFGGLAVFTAGSELLDVNGTIFTNTAICSGSLGPTSTGVGISGQSNSTIVSFLANNPSVTFRQFNDKIGTIYKSLSGYTFNPNAPATPMVAGARFIDWDINSTPYVAGSGLSVIYTTPIPANIFVRPGGFPWSSFEPMGHIEFHGIVASSAAANGQISVQLVQGANTYNFATAATIPAYVSNTDLIKIDIRFRQGSSLIFVETEIGGVAYGASAQSTALNYAAAMTLNVLASNTGSNPFDLLHIRASV